LTVLEGLGDSFGMETVGDIGDGLGCCLTADDELLALGVEVTGEATEVGD